MLPEVSKEVWEKSEELSKRHTIKIPKLSESQDRRKQYQNQAKEVKPRIWSFSYLSTF